MIPKQDLKTARLALGLTAKDLAAGILTAGTLSEIESGKRFPHKSTRLRLQSIIGPVVDWRLTLAGEDKSHLIFAITQFINPDGEGDARERIKFTKQVLQLLEDELNN